MCFIGCDKISGTYWTALACLTRDFHPLRFSQIILFACDGSRPCMGRFNARTQGQAYHCTDMRVMASSLPQLVVRPAAAPPIPPSLCWDHGQLTSARLSSRAAYQTYPVDLFNYQGCCQPAQIHLSGGPGPDGKRCRKCVSI